MSLSSNLVQIPTYWGANDPGLPGATAKQMAAACIMVVRSIGWLSIVAFLSCAAGYSFFGEGRDFWNYSTFFSALTKELAAGDHRYEPGFVLLAWIFKFIFRLGHEELTAFVVLVSLAMKVYLFHRYTRWPVLAFIAYFCLFYPILEYAQIRAGLALALAYWALLLGSEKRWIQGGIAMLSALMFHYTSALLGFVFVMMWLFRYERKFNAALMLGALLTMGGALAFQQFDSLLLLNPLLNNYIELADEAQTPSVFSVFNLMLAGALLGYMTSNLPGNRSARVFVLLTGASLVAFALLYSIPVLAQRVKDLLALSIIFWALNGRLRLTEFAPTAMLMLGSMGVFVSYVKQGVIFL